MSPVSAGRVYIKCIGKPFLLNSRSKNPFCRRRTTNVSKTDEENSYSLIIIRFYILFFVHSVIILSALCRMWRNYGMNGVNVFYLLEHLFMVF